MTTRLTVLSREWCHLCHDMVEALRPLSEELGFDFDIVDVDLDPDLEDRWGELVPVLLAGETELCHYHLDCTAIRTHLQKIR